MQYCYKLIICIYMIKNIWDDKYIFFYGAIVQIYIASAFYLNKSRETDGFIKNILIIGILFLAIDMILRINKENKGTIYSSIIGITGHTLIMVYYILVALTTVSFYNINFKSIFDIGIIIGQISVILLYLLEIIYNNKKKSYLVKSFYVYIFLLLTILFISHSFYSKISGNKMFLSYLFLGILNYLFLMYEILPKE